MRAAPACLTSAKLRSPAFAFVDNVLSLGAVRQWSWKIGRFFGIDTEVHASFLLLLAWVIFGAFSDGGTLMTATYAVVFLFGVFASVVLHELGHALTARAYGVQTRRILLLPIGGMAQLQGLPKQPRAELAIALAGPAVSLLLAAVLALWSTLLAGVTGGATLVDAFLSSLMVANLMIAVFNLVPAFPMDGGRALRAWLAGRMDYLRATERAVMIGRVAAAGFVIFGLFYAPVLALIGVFVWLAAGAELRATRINTERARMYDMSRWYPFMGPQPPRQD